MLNQIGEFLKAADQAACKMFNDYDEVLTGAALIALGTGKGAPVAAGITLAQMAAKYGCTWENPPPPGGCNGICGCKKCDGQGYINISATDGSWSQSGTILAHEIVWVRQGNPRGSGLTVGILMAPSSTEVGEVWIDGPEGKTFCASLGCYSGEKKCLERCSGDDPPPMPPVDPIPYTTEDGCTFNLNFEGLGQLPSGQGDFIWRIEPAETSRAGGGGVIGGCNFQPTIYFGGGGSGDGGGPGAPFTVPYDPTPGDDGLPLWQDLLTKAIPIAIGNLAASAISELFRAQLPPSEFLFVAPCDKDENEKPLEVLYQMPQQDYQSRVVTQQAVIMEILQQHLNWKTPVCFPKNEKGAYARSITFWSDENTDSGNSRCTKRFGYRADTPCELESLYEHWRNFVWNTGPVVVGHSGSALGSPQVWASSEFEGKRVIHHAAREAGVDPDQTGEWSIGGSDNPRYGLSHTVKLKQVRGIWQASCREGPSPRPAMVETFPDL